ncbi:hypothetical protein [Thermomonospora catenispora]|uniref:hypothetical protein n=1 Tax=Thermomonospora catenispora TaxID=2493090 RepID=UPI001F4F585A|nr:hypothetical protein [Thermomonospora catenispora]
MTECEKCGLTIGLGCACDLSFSSSRRPHGKSGGWSGFAPDTILISRQNMAHIPGACGHMTEEHVRDPDNGWGWIPDPDPGLWHRISPANPARATEGDTSRVATTRCSSCAAALSS